MPKVREVIARLEAEGWRLVRTRGSHRQYKLGDRPLLVTLAGHPNDDIPPGTWSDIQKKAGWK